MGHMIADSLAELHAMASAIGMRREWYQPLSFPHYDVSIERRRIAVSLGALRIDRRGIATTMRRLRLDPHFVEEVERSHRLMGHPSPFQRR